MSGEAYLGIGEYCENFTTTENVKLPISSSTRSEVASSIVDAVVTESLNSQSHRPDHIEPENPSPTHLATSIAGHLGVHVDTNEGRLQSNMLHKIHQIRKLMASLKRDRNGEPTSGPIVVAEVYGEHYADLNSAMASSSHPILSRRNYELPLTDLVFTVEDIRQLLHKFNMDFSQKFLRVEHTCIVDCLSESKDDIGECCENRTSTEAVKLPISSSTPSKVASLIVDTTVAQDHDNQSHKPDHGEPNSPSYTQLATLIAGDSDDHTGAEERRLRPNKPYTTSQIRKLLAGFKVQSSEKTSLMGAPPKKLPSAATQRSKHHRGTFPTKSRQNAQETKQTRDRPLSNSEPGS
ncbi:hypothetical protein CLF_100791 [Clonorchis sinensis]|uniref:Uncharacterized protein n=1 Tax=Clonorchis sinensis TaxID=79923 RepID=G7Y493_CLOSI|nr:hypothetical protein CLF_100791 [Clonorchis sinensis]